MVFVEIEPRDESALFSSLISNTVLTIFHVKRNAPFGKKCTLIFPPFSSWVVPDVPEPTGNLHVNHTILLGIPYQLP